MSDYFLPVEWDKLESKKISYRDTPRRKYLAHPTAVNQQVCRECGVTITEYAYKVPLSEWHGPLEMVATEFRDRTDNVEIHERFHDSIEALSDKISDLRQELTS